MFALVGQNAASLPLFISMKEGDNGNSDSTLTLGDPGSIADGDFLIAFIWNRGNATVSSFTGFTQRAASTITIDSTSRRLEIWTKVASSESGDYTVNMSSGQDANVGVILCYRNANATLDLATITGINTGAVTRCSGPSP